MIPREPHHERIRNLPIWLGLGISALLIATAIFLTPATLASAQPADLAGAEAQYPVMVGSRIDTCVLCHTSSIPNLNPFGAAYLANGRNAAALVAIQNFDSDGDGFTNIQEINALTFPGDPADHPVAAASATPTRAPSATPVATRAATSTRTATSAAYPPPVTLTPGGEITSTSTEVASATPRSNVTRTPTRVGTRRATDQDDSHPRTSTPRVTRTPRPKPKPTQVCLTPRGDRDDARPSVASVAAIDRSRCDDGRPSAEHTSTPGFGDLLSSWWNAIVARFRPN